MNLKRVFAISRRLLEQFRHDRRTLALMFLAPIVLLSLLGYLLRGSSSHPAVAVVNTDTGALGRVITTQLLQSKLVSASEMDASQAEDRLKRGEVVGYIVFPNNFSERSFREGVIAPEVHLEGSQPGPNQTVIQALAQAEAAAAGSAGPKVEPQVTYLYGGPNLDTLDYFGAAFIGLVVFFLVFVVTSIAFLRERMQGTLERLMASPLRRGEIVLGYMLGFSVVALLQGLIVLLFSLYILRVHNAGNVGLIFLMEALMAIGAVNLGIFLSVFARTEFQAVQFIPLVIVPQVLLSGILFPVSSEPRVLQYLSNVLPLTYAVYGLRDVMIKGSDFASRALQLDALVVLGFCLLMIAAATATLRRRIA